MVEKPNHKNQTDLAEPEDALPALALEDLSPALQQAVIRAGWSELTPVQSRAIPYMLARRDLMVQARTGSGKTGAFVLPILERVDPQKPQCQALVLTPTRELAQQVAADARTLAGEGGMRTVAVYGGSSYKPQIEGFKKGAHLVVGTPGRVLDHLYKRNLTLKELKILVFDEADRMMSMGFYPDMVEIQSFLPDRAINAYMFSATFPNQVIGLANQFLTKPGFLSLSRDHIHVEDTEHIYYLVSGMEKDRSLVRIIELENPYQTIIFCNTKDRVNYVTQVLRRYGYNADQLSSDLAQKVRDKVLQKVRDGTLRFLIATDVAARGIDIPDLTHVIQYEPPEDPEAYIHRAGRTGRAGASGTAIMLVYHSEKRQVTRIGAQFGIEFKERPVPTREEVQALVSQRLIGQLEARLRNRDKLQVDRMDRFVPLAEKLAGQEEGRILLAMLLDDTYHDWMHQPPDQPLSSPAKKGRKSKGRRRSGGGRSRKRRSRKGN